jgi:hypothetical protein
MKTLEDHNDNIHEQMKRLFEPRLPSNDGSYGCRNNNGTLTEGQP